MEYRSLPLTKMRSYGVTRRFVFVCVSLPMVLFAVQLFYLTIVSHDAFQQQADDNLTDLRRLSYPRGNILDANGVVLATNRRSYTITFRPYGMRDIQAREVLNRISQQLGGILTSQRIDEILEFRPRWTRHDLARHLTQEEALPFFERSADYPGVRIHEDYERVYAMPTDCAHIIGYLSKIQPGEEEIYTRPRYLLSDEVGRTGLERSYQERLAGHPGRELIRRDAKGQNLAEPEVESVAQPGEDLFLALDAGIQRKAMELLAPPDGSNRTGSIILMEARTGGIVALASWPTYDAASPGAPLPDGTAPGYVCLAYRGLYPPGSTFKIVGAAAALREGIPASHTVTCSGSFRYPGWQRPFRCNAHHGTVDLSDALKESCNVYFYDLAYEEGFQPLRRSGEAFGFGRATGIDLPGEKGGQLAGSMEPSGGETINLAIGQGSMLATPLQVARAYAGLANDGLMPRPHVVRAIGRDRRSAEKTALEFESIGLSSSQIARITDGLWRAVNEPGGTAYKAHIPRSWDVVGKTGTAENPRGLNDAWFAGFFPRSDPEYVFVIHVEDTTMHGGEEAAPIARDLIEAVLARNDERLARVVRE